jgi:hypothetical protein
MKKYLVSLLSLIALSTTACGTNISNTVPTNNKPTTEKKDVIVISGLVQDDKGIPSSDVDIVVKDDTKELGKTKTNEKGEFTIEVPKIFGDSYFIEAKKNVSDGTLSQTLLISSTEKADFTGDNKLKKTVVAVKPVPLN